MPMATIIPCWFGQMLGTSGGVLCLDTIYWVFSRDTNMVEAIFTPTLTAYVTMEYTQTQIIREWSCLRCCWHKILRHSNPRQHMSCHCCPLVPSPSLLRHSRSLQDIVEVTVGWSVSVYCMSILMFCTWAANKDCIFSRSGSGHPAYHIFCRPKCVQRLYIRIVQLEP